MSLNHSDLSSKEYDGLFEKQIPYPFLQNALLDKDIWHTQKDLSLKINEHKRIFTLDFSPIKQKWLKLLAKLYVLIKSNPSVPSQTIHNHLSRLRVFSIFLDAENITKYKSIDGQTLENFTFYLINKGNKEATIFHYYSTLKIFFYTCKIEGFIDNNIYYWFKSKSRYRYPKNTEYIPEEVWNQLENNLYLLPEQLQRQILIIRSLGLRVGELLQIPLDCTRKRKNQWRIRLTTEKYNIDDELPISAELAAIIKEQQLYIKESFDGNFNNLFCSNTSGHHSKNGFSFKPSPKVMDGKIFNLWLNRLSDKCNICDKNGKKWKFRSHQFRKTVATIMTNAGIRDLIIQKYLRHRSPDMQNYYKHLLKQVIGDEYRELMKDTKYVDSTGKTVATHRPKNPITELMRRKMHQITTQYGECHRPVLKSPCQTVNACWRCEHWRTSTNDLTYLQQDLQKVEDEIMIAKKLGMVRQQQGLVNDRDNLAIRIKGIEKIIYAKN